MDINALLAMLLQGPSPSSQPMGMGVSADATYERGKQQHLIQTIIEGMGGKQPFMGSAPENPGATAGGYDPGVPGANVPEDIYQKYGLGNDETESYIRQALGLELTPLQQQAGQQNVIKALPDFMNAQSNQVKAQADATTAGAKVTETETGKREVAVKESAEARLLRQFNEGTAEQKVAMYEMNLKNIALTGLTLEGKTVGKDIRQNAYALLRGTQSTPGLSALITQLAQAGEWDAAGKLVGLPAGALKKTWWSGVQIDPKAAKTISEASGGIVQSQAGTPEEDAARAKQIQDMTEQFRANFFDIMKKAGESR